MCASACVCVGGVCAHVCMVCGACVECGAWCVVRGACVECAACVVCVVCVWCGVVVVLWCVSVSGARSAVFELFTPYFLKKMREF